MAGGIFPGKPFNWNVKCIVFTIFIAAGYWYLPPKNLYVLAFLLWLPYIALAWYDYSYDCKDKLQPTLIPYGRTMFLPFKPAGYKQEFDKMPKDQIQAMDTLDHLVTWTLLVIVIFYAFLRKKA